MIQPESKQEIPDIRSLLHPKRKDDRKGVLDEILHSNKNNPSKSRIPNPAGMAVYQGLGLWGSPKKTFNYEVQGEVKQFQRNVEGLHDLFKRVYDENAVSLWPGKSREEYVTASLGYFLQDLEDIERTKQTRMEEGAKKK